MVKDRKDPYVVFDPSTGFKKRSSDERIDEDVSKKQYGDLRIRSGGGEFGVDVPVFPWLVWSIRKKVFHLETSAVDIPERDLRLAKEAVSGAPAPTKPKRNRKVSKRRGKK